jgi:hypothetical protein
MARIEPSVASVAAFTGSTGPTGVSGATGAGATGATGAGGGVTQIGVTEVFAGRTENPVLAGTVGPLPHPNTGTWQVDGTYLVCSNVSEGQILWYTDCLKYTLTAVFHKHPSDGGLIWSADARLDDYFLLEANAGVFQLNQRVGGAFTAIGAPFGTPADDDTIVVVATGSHYIVKVNGSTVATLDNDRVTPHPFVGFRASGDTALRVTSLVVTPTA